MKKEIEMFINEYLEEMDELKTDFMQLLGLTKAIDLSFRNDNDMPLSFTGVTKFLKVETETAFSYLEDFKSLLKRSDYWENLEQLHNDMKTTLNNTEDIISNVGFVAESLFHALIEYNTPLENRNSESLNIIKSYHIGTADAIKNKAKEITGQIFTSVANINICLEDKETDNGADAKNDD